MADYTFHFGEQNHKDIKGVTPQAMDSLLKHDWPGNVRELINGLERATVLARSEYIDTKDLPLISAREARPGGGHCCSGAGKSTSRRNRKGSCSPDLRGMWWK